MTVRTADALGDLTPLLDEVINVQPGTAWAPHLVTRCRFRLFRGAESCLQFAQPVAIITELSDNPGPSVTNAAEHIWRALARRLDTLVFTMIEHYGPESYAWDRANTFDIVNISGRREPEWRPIPVHDVRRLVM